MIQGPTAGQKSDFISAEYKLVWKPYIILPDTLVDQKKAPR